jgi:hypothetical protein
LWLVLAAISVFSGCEEDESVEELLIDSNDKDWISVVTGVTVSPSSQTVAKGGSFQFSATVQGTNSPSQAVTWSIAGGGGGGYQYRYFNRRPVDGGRRRDGS